MSILQILFPQQLRYYSTTRDRMVLRCTMPYDLRVEFDAQPDLDGDFPARHQWYC